MLVHRLSIADFRSYRAATLEPAPEGLTVIKGGNGQGKTNLLEALAYLALGSSFRGVPQEALVRTGRDHAVVRGEIDRGGRRMLVEAELHASGGRRVQLNRQPVRRGRDLLDGLRVSVFSPVDLSVVKEGPGERRRYLDDLLVALHPAADVTRSETERILRQRNTLLKQAGGRLSPEVAATLDVWDAKLADRGERLATERNRLAQRLEPVVAAAYRELAGAAVDVITRYERSWSGSLADALGASRSDDLRRGVTHVGPHRDDVELVISGLPARTHASQGEQRTLALALRLAAHLLVTEVLGETPVLLLDDVFSELDAARGEALVAALPAGQAVLTTTNAVPPAVRPVHTVSVVGGALEAAA